MLITEANRHHVDNKTWCLFDVCSRPTTNHTPLKYKRPINLRPCIRRIQMLSKVVTLGKSSNFPDCRPYHQLLVQIYWRFPPHAGWKRWIYHRNHMNGTSTCGATVPLSMPVLDLDLSAWYFSRRDWRTSEMQFHSQDIQEKLTCR